MRSLPLHSIQRARGMGFLPALIAALPALASAAGSIAGNKAEQKAARDAEDARLEMAKIQARTDKANAAARAKWMPWAIGGGIVVVGFGLWALSRRRSAS